MCSSQIPQTSYMTNAKKLDEACPLRSFARADQPTKHELAKAYCAAPKEAQGACATYAANR
jgi:hypothetical protein